MYRGNFRNNPLSILTYNSKKEVGETEERHCIRSAYYITKRFPPIFENLLVFRLRFTRMRALIGSI